MLRWNRELLPLRIPMACRISPMESPTLGVGLEKGRRYRIRRREFEQVRGPESSPTRVTRKAVILISSAMSARVRLSAPTSSTRRCRARLMTPGPETPMLIDGVAFALAVGGSGHEGVVVGHVREDD